MQFIIILFTHLGQTLISGSLNKFVLIIYVYLNIVHFWSLHRLRTESIIHSSRATQFRTDLDNQELTVITKSDVYCFH